MRARLQLFSAVLHAQHACAMVLSLSLCLSLPFMGRTLSPSQMFIANADAMAFLVQQQCRVFYRPPAPPRHGPIRPGLPTRSRTGRGLLFLCRRNCVKKEQNAVL